MIEPYIQIPELIHKERIGIITAEEKRELEEWLNEADSHHLLYKQLTENRNWEKEYRQYQQIAADPVWKNIERKIKPEKKFFFIPLDQGGRCCGFVGRDRIMFSLWG